MSEIIKCKLKAAWNRFRPTGQLFDYTKERPLRVRIPLPQATYSRSNTKEVLRSISVELFLEKITLSGLPVFQIIGAVPDRNLKVVLETIMDLNNSSSGQQAIQL